MAVKSHVHQYCRNVGMAEREQAAVFGLATPRACIFVFDESGDRVGLLLPNPVMKDNLTDDLWICLYRKFSNSMI